MREEEPLGGIYMSVYFLQEFDFMQLQELASSVCEAPVFLSDAGA